MAELPPTILDDVISASCVQEVLCKRKRRHPRWKSKRRFHPLVPLSQRGLKKVPHDLDDVISGCTILGGVIQDC